MDIAGSLLAAFGLSASAGLNAYIPLLIVALAARLTDWFNLNRPWDGLESWWVIGALVVLTLIEFFADKAPAVNHVNDAIQTFVRPAAGAILFAASTGAVSEIHPVVALIAGLIVAGGVHTVKAAAVRPAVTATTGGAGNLAVSLAEDILAAVISIAAVVIPVVIAVLLIVVVSLFIWWLWRRTNALSTG
jgi:hypothetical protein